MQERQNRLKVLIAYCMRMNILEKSLTEREKSKDLDI